MRFFQKTALILTVSLCLLVLSTTVLAGPNAQGGGLTTTTTMEIWLRSGPGVEWRKLEIMPLGTTVALDGHDSSGLWVRGITSGGTVGWMAARYVTASQDAIWALPSIWVDAPFSLSAPAAGSAPATTASAAPATTTTETTTAAPVTSGGQDITTTAQLNMRSGPTTAYRVIAVLKQGEVLRLDGKDSSGMWARGISSAGQVGWVYATYLSGSIAGLPIVGIDTPFGLSAPQGAAATTNSASSPTTSLPAPVVNAAPVSGFNLGGHVSGFGDSTVNWMRAAGMNWVKRQVRVGQGSDPGGAAGLINDAHAKGFRILLGVVGEPSQINNGGYFEWYASYVGGLAALGADAIEVWNEQNIDREWPAGSIDPGRYTQMLAQAYNAIKGANSSTMVISGALAPTGFFGGCSGNGCDDAPYISGMAAAGAANYMDCLGIHYNEGIVPPTQTSGDPRSEHYTRYFWGMINTYYSAFGGARPLCFTELGYLSPEGYGQLPGGFAWAQGTTVAQQAAWLDQAVSMAANSGKVRLLIVWNMDFREFGADPQGGYAIIRPDGSCPACSALGS